MGLTILLVTPWFIIVAQLKPSFFLLLDEADTQLVKGADRRKRD